MKEFSKIMGAVFLALIAEALLVELTKRFSVNVGHGALIERLRMIFVLVGLASFWLEIALKRRFDRQTVPIDTTADYLGSLDHVQNRHFGSRLLLGIVSASGAVFMTAVLVSMFINAC
jgi:hypothetical protein